MTIVLAERRPSGIIVLMSDSKISGGAQTVAGGKIFPITVRGTFYGQDDGVNDVPVRGLGYAYAGSTLAATNCFSLASAALSNLSVPFDTARPSMKDIADFFGRCAEEVVIDLINLTPNAQADPSRYYFGALIAGHDDSADLASLYRLTISFKTGSLKFNIEEVNLVPGKVFSMGSAQPRFVAMIEYAYSRGLDLTAFQALELFLSIDKMEDIGGWIQFGSTRYDRFIIKPTARISDGHPISPSSIMLAGIDTYNLGKVGDASIGHNVEGSAPLGWLVQAKELMSDFPGSAYLRP